MKYSYHSRLATEHVAKNIQNSLSNRVYLSYLQTHISVEKNTTYLIFSNLILILIPDFQNTHGG